jgi:hypothetical protein
VRCDDGTLILFRALRKYETPVNRYRTTPQIVKAQPKIKARVPYQESFNAKRRNGKA